MKKPIRFTTVAMYTFISIASFFSAFPFFWMLSAATNKSVDVIKGKLFFGTYLIENVKQLLAVTNITQAFWNSTRNTVIGTLVSIFVCSLAGYGFQIYRDKAKDRLMGILMISMMVPFASIMVPLYRMFSRVHLLNTTLGFILPSLATVFLIFFFRQSSASFPMEIVQAARVDGVGELGIYLRIYMPIMAPTFAAAAIITFMANWNNYLWPLIIMQKQESRTMPMVLTGLTAGYTTDYGILMLAVTICTLPTVVLFFTQQRRFVEGILGSVK
ncbi:MAG: carbohydrate ABC transporter permease [Treponema sp.]|jgi:lactose/L-arabinose transport system permease protein|nr:carbohydrate ABC transporter permease [Treponema sp.]